MRRHVEHEAHSQRPPLIGPIVHQRGCRNRHGEWTRAAHARARHAVPRYRLVMRRLSQAVVGNGRRSGQDQLVKTVKAGGKSRRRADAVATARPGGDGRKQALDHQDRQGPGSQLRQPLEMTRSHHAFVAVGDKSLAHNDPTVNRCVGSTDFSRRPRPNMANLIYSAARTRCKREKDARHPLSLYVCSANVPEPTETVPDDRFIIIIITPLVWGWCSLVRDE